MTKLKNLDHHDFICSAYLNRTMTITELQKTFKMSPNTIYKILKDGGIELRGSKLDKNKASEICDLYKEGLTIEKIQEKTGIGKSCIIKQLQKHSVPTRKSYRKYDLDESIFETIDSKEKAQFLGLVYADGTISKNNNLIAIRLREDDIDYLENWKYHLLKTNKPIYFVKNSGYMHNPINNKKYETPLRAASLDITSGKVYKDAINLGLSINKTYKNLNMPKIDEKFKSAFILGLFEGDGCITSSGFTIACQSNMAEDLKNYFDSIDIFSCNFKRQYTNIIQISRKKDLIKLYYLLYDPQPLVAMKRKQEKFKNIIDQFFHTSHNPNLSSFLRTTSCTNPDEYITSLSSQ